MVKLSILFTSGLLVCLIDHVISNGYYYYPNSLGSMILQPYSGPYGPSLVPVNCDKKEGSSSSSSESNSSESKEEGKKEEGKKEEGEKKEGESGEVKEGGEGEGGKSGEEKKEGSGEEKEEKKEKKKPKKSKEYVFPPVSFPYAVKGPQQYVYSPPMSYSLQQQPVKGGYYYAPGSAAYNPAAYGSSTAYGSPVAKYVNSPVGNAFSYPSYWNPSSSYVYYKK